MGRVRIWLPFQLVGHWSVEWCRRLSNEGVLGLARAVLDMASIHGCHILRPLTAVQTLHLLRLLPPSLALCWLKWSAMA